MILTLIAMWVAPYAGAWIETEETDPATLLLLSLPMRERGLKPVMAVSRGDAGQSLPMRERGLKPQMFPTKRHGEAVAPYAGAWIETPNYNYSDTRPGRSLCGSVD